MRAMTQRSGRPIFAIFIAVTASLMAGCAKKEEPPAPVPAPAPVAEAAPAPVIPDGPVAIAEIAGPEGSAVKGVVTFRASGSSVHIEARVTGLSVGSHGFHVHEKGDCGGDFSGAGPHFNPAGHAHAGPDAAEAHAGDLGNLLAAADGNAQITMRSRRFTLDDGPNGIIGKSVIVHAEQDDLATQPTGNSGARIACGVIVLQSGETAAPSGESGAANH
jgi:Cu-Zn family superoxide dismutase